MKELYGIIILTIVKMFLVVLALYRLHTIDKIQKECDRKIKQIKESLLSIQEENARLRTFKYVVEDIVTGKRTDIEKIEKINELLFEQKQ